MASITKRSGNYRALIRIQGRAPLSKTFNRRADAQAWARQVETDIQRGVFLDLTEAQQTSLAAALDRYERAVLPSKKDQNVKWVIKRVKAGLGSLALAAVTPAALASFRDDRLKQGADPQTVRKDLGLVSSVLNVAQRDWGIHLPHGNPVRMVRMPSIPRGRDRRPTADELAMLRDDKTVGVLVTLAVETGMRRGELAHMRWENISWTRRTLLIPITKTDTPREVPLTETALEALRGVLRGTKVVDIQLEATGAVFPQRADSISQSFERACQRYGIEGLRFHDLRHEATSRFFELGLNPMEVASITGHEDLKMLKRYTHIRPENLLEKLSQSRL
jgi:integrase